MFNSILGTGNPQNSLNACIGRDKILRTDLSSKSCWTLWPYLWALHGSVNSNGGRIWERPAQWPLWVVSGSAFFSQPLAVLLSWIMNAELESWRPGILFQVWSPGNKVLAWPGRWPLPRHGQFCWRAGLLVLTPSFRVCTCTSSWLRPSWVKGGSPRPPCVANPGFAWGRFSLPAEPHRLYRWGHRV